MWNGELVLPIWLEEDHLQSLLGQDLLDSEVGSWCDLGPLSGVQLFLDTQEMASPFYSCSHQPPKGAPAQGPALERFTTNHNIFKKNLKILHYLCHSRSCVTCNFKHLFFITVQAPGEQFLHILAPYLQNKVTTKEYLKVYWS